MANRIIPQLAVDGGIADLVVITKAGYLTEIEIKISASDWRADLAKDKWRARGHYVNGVYTPAGSGEIVRPTVSRFFYAVPADLVARAPENLPAGSGILAVHQRNRSWGYVEVVRPAVRTKARKLAQNEVNELLSCFYLRWWRQEFARWTEAIDENVVETTDLALASPAEIDG